MPKRSNFGIDGRTFALLPSTAITTAVTGVSGTVITGLAGLTYLVVQAKFTYGSGGTTGKFWVQTSFDKGTTWTDIQCFAFTTTSATKFQACKIYIALAANKTIGDVALADNTILDGVFGDRVKVKYTTTGTYAGSTAIKMDAVVG